MNTIKSPFITEKSTFGITNGLYVFEITPNANKTTVAEELKNIYNVDALSVRIVNLPAKQKTFKRVKGIRNIRRKAYVQLKEKQTIPGFETLTKAKETK
ncbi:50S ribosomal protein L23 [Candidatus Berkelbacteria bacterium]|nr:50S ribosomal protein L23 [Candidatus Berkelbacteria bacterium]